MYTSNSGTDYGFRDSVNNNNKGWYNKYYNTAGSAFDEADIFNQSGDFLGSADSQAALDNYITYLSDNPTGTTSATNENDFNSEEFTEFKKLSLDLADKSEARDVRLMKQAAIERDKEYTRNNTRANDLFNIGARSGMGSSGGSSYRYDGLS